MKRITPLNLIRRRFASADFPAAEVQETACPETGAPDTSPLSPRIQQLLSELQAAEKALFHPIPLVGQIVRVPPLIGKKASGCQEYLAVLLDSEVALGKWRGWLVGRDADYAGEWDLLLGPEDEPRDPICQVVQVWNPLTLPIRAADKVLAELNPSRLAAVRTMALDHREHRIPEPVADYRCGVHIARLLSDGTGVVTGTPLAPQDDPRSEYQALYREVGLWISQQGIQAEAPAMPRPASPGSPPLWERLKDSFSFGGHWLRPVAALAVLLVVPLLVIQVWRADTDQTSIPQGSYISGSGQQELPATDPAAKAMEIENQLRALGVQPEIRFESGGDIVVMANLTELPDTERKSWLANHGLTDPSPNPLRLIIVSSGSATPKVRP